MNDKTLNARSQQLYVQVYVHPYKEEIMQLMHEQQLDDADMCSESYYE